MKGVILLYIAIYLVFSTLGGGFMVGFWVGWVLGVGGGGGCFL